MTHSEPGAVAWPADAIDASAGDLAVPLRNLLVELNILETKADQDASGKKFGGKATPWSLQVITAGSLQLSKVVSGLVGALGGGAALWAAIKGFALSQHDPDRLAYIGAATAIVAVVALALAVVVRSDVMARAQATAAEYEARAQTAAAFLAAARPVAARSRYVIRIGDYDKWQLVESFEMSERSLIANIAGRKVPAKDIEAIASVPDWV